MRKFTTLLPVLLICSVHLLSAEARADDPVVISKGSFYFNRQLGASFRYRIEGRNFAATGYLEHENVNPRLQCSPCRPGTVISADGLFGGFTGSGELTIDGVTYPKAYYDGSFTFKSESIALPLIPSDLVVKMPFTFTGYLWAYETDRRERPFFQTGLNGRGVATIWMRVTPLFFGTGYHYEYHSMIYDFNPKAAPPRQPVIIREPWRRRFKSRTR